MRTMRAVVTSRPGDYDVMRLEEAPRVHRLMVERKLSRRVLLGP